MKQKPSIEELEKILNGKCPPVNIAPNGELKMDYEKCPFRIECFATPKSSKEVQHSKEEAIFEVNLKKEVKHFDITKEIPPNKEGIVKPNYTIRAFASHGMLVLQGRGGMRGPNEIREDFTVTIESAPIIAELIESFFPKLTRSYYSKDRVLFREKLHSTKFVNACVTIHAPRDYTIKTKDGEKEVHDGDIQITHPDTTMDVMEEKEFLLKYEPANDSARELIEKFTSW